jgi:hypothetical protein
MRKFTLEELLISIRNRIITAIDQNDRKLFEEMHIALWIIIESAYASEDKFFLTIVHQLKDVAQDGSMGMAFKSNLPSETDIHNALVW